MKEISAINAVMAGFCRTKIEIARGSSGISVGSSIMERGMIDSGVGARLSGSSKCKGRSVKD